MRLAFDTSVLVAALVEPHPLHNRALPWLDAVREKRASGECSVHALAETWSVLTRLPIDPAIAPAMATVALERVAEILQPVEIDVDAYWSAIRRCSERGVRSGALFDALHLVVTESNGADALVTFNPNDFLRLTTQDSPVIVVPPDPPGCDLSVL
jgi:predicted nucleic acid-binding protein